MKYCKHLHGSLLFWKECVGFCCTPLNKHFPIIPFRKGFSLETILIVRDALINSLNADLDKPPEEYIKYGHPLYSKLCHPCKDCHRMIELDEVPPPPLDIQLQYYSQLFASGCNAKCDYCINSEGTDAGDIPKSAMSTHEIEQDIDIRLFYQLINENKIMPSCEILFSGGEPAIHKQSMNILSILTQRRQSVHILTNAIRFAPEIETALNAGNCKVTVNIDSGNSDSYRLIKGVDKFDDVMGNIDQYVKVAEGKHYFELRYIVYDKNNAQSNINGFCEICIEHKIKNVAVSFNYNEGGGKQVKVSDNSIHAMAFLIRRLEIVGIHVRKDYMLLSELERLSIAYAELILPTFHRKTKKTSIIRNVACGFRLSTFELESPILKRYLTKILKTVLKHTKNFAFFGCGNSAEYIYEIILQSGLKTPSVILDNNPRPFKFGIPVINPTETKQYCLDTIFLCSNVYHYQIYYQLKDNPTFKEIKIIDPFFYPSIGEGDFNIQYDAMPENDSWH